VESLKDEVRTEIHVGMVDKRYTIFEKVKSVAEALDLNCEGSAIRLYRWIVNHLAGQEVQYPGI
jgi:hypothetical protein